MLHFIRKLKSIHPDMIVSQPTYGYPQVVTMVKTFGFKKSLRYQTLCLSVCLSVIKSLSSPFKELTLSQLQAG